MSWIERDRVLNCMRGIRFVYHAIRSDFRHFVNEEDVRVVLSRLPAELWERLRAVHFGRPQRGGKVLGYVNRGRREVSLLALPRRVALRNIFPRQHGPLLFGAPPGCQWPTLAVRRMMLYGVLLHEIGHLQPVRPNGRSERLRFARERRAEEFEAYWRRRLWATPFDHPDPVHNPPAEREVHEVRQTWGAGHALYKRGLARLARPGGKELAAPLFAEAAVACRRHAPAREALATQAIDRRNFGGAARLARDALAHDPTLPGAILSLARALMWQRRYEQAEPMFARAERLDLHKPWAMTIHAVSLSKWGRHEEADALFRKVLRFASGWVGGWQEYGWALARESAADATKLGAAVAALERAIDLNPEDADGFYLLGRVLEPVDPERALALARRALQVEPEHGGAMELFERLGPTAREG